MVQEKYFILMFEDRKFFKGIGRGGQLVRDQEPHFLLCYCKEPITKLTTLNLNTASYETRFLLHDIAQGFYAVIPGKLSARTVYSTYIHSSTFVSSFALPFLRLHMPAHAHTCEHASHEWDGLCMFLRTPQSALTRNTATNTCVA